MEYMSWFYDHIVSIGTPDQAFEWDMDWRDWTTEEVLLKAESEFSKALNATKDQPDYHKRIRAAYLPILWARAQTPSRGQDVSREAGDLFLEIVAENGYCGWSDGIGWDANNARKFLVR